MNFVSNRPKFLLLIGAAAMAAPGSLAAQSEMPAQQDTSAQQQSTGNEVLTTVQASAPSDLSGLPNGPEVEGIISARRGNSVQITTNDGNNTTVILSDATQIKASGGFLGLGHSKLAATSLLNGLPVSVETVQWNQGLVASKIDLKSKDLKTAAMIRNGTDQRFGEQGAAIQQNAAATEALRGRVANIDQYNVKGTTNVYFDTGKAVLSSESKEELCQAATEADGMNNALLLVVGYTDSTGSDEINQVLSEKRAAKVVNYLQQKCGWKPYRMLTPTGMAEADPAASNDTAQGKAQNRRVAVNILVSKSVDGM